MASGQLNPEQQKELEQSILDYVYGWMGDYVIVYPMEDKKCGVFKSIINYLKNKIKWT